VVGHGAGWGYLFDSTAIMPEGENANYLGLSVGMGVIVVLPVFPRAKFKSKNKRGPSPSA